MSYDTEDQTELVCPYCGYRDPDSWEETYPDTHECIRDMADENAKLQNDADLLRAIWRQERTEKQCYMAENAKLRKLVSDMGKMLTLASWTSVENDEQASQCIYRAEALGIEVDE